VGIAGLIIGVITFIGFLIVFIPLLGWFNWFNIPFAAVGLVLSIIGLATTKGSKGAAIARAILCGAAIILGGFRLALGGGFI
jgi:hypothetical protein